MRATARWRKQKAGQFADDPLARQRSHRAMVAISHAAKLVEDLADADRDLGWPRHVDGRGEHVELCEQSLCLLSRFGIDRGAWDRGDGRPDELQVRELPRRLGGAEAHQRAAQRRGQSA